VCIYIHIHICVHVPDNREANAMEKKKN